MPPFDPSRPSIARVYNYLVGGKDNFAADRALATRLCGIAPSVGLMARDNRQFLARAVEWTARQGVEQFIDLGCGLPVPPSTRATAQAVAPAARVVYIDNDPVVATHLRAKVSNQDTAAALEMDITDTAAVIGAAAGHLDLDRPVCLLMGALLHFYTAPAARALVAGYASALAAGSYLALTIGQAASGPEADKLASLYSAALRPVLNHSAEDFCAFFAGLELVPPGVADARAWRPGWDRVPQPGERATWTIVGLARVPSAPRPRRTETARRSSHFPRHRKPGSPSLPRRQVLACRGHYRRSS